MKQDTPSRTARKVALNIVTLGSHKGMEKILPAGLVETTEELLVGSGVVDARLIQFAKSQIAIKIYQAFDWMMPGQFEAFGYRKAFCERQVREGIAAGCKQVLVLGAGYDTLCFRLSSEFPEVNFFEIDHPATARVKALGMEKMGRKENHILIAEDLAERQLVDVLSSTSTWNPASPSIFVAEGLLMYLPPEAVRELCEQLAESSGSKSRFVFSYIGQQPDGRPDAGPWTWLVLTTLKASGEPWLWSINPEDLGPFLQEHGWTLKGDTEPTRYGIEFVGLAMK